MKCRELKFEIQQYSDGELAPGRSGAVELHLDSCPLCRTELDSIRSLRSELGSLRRQEIPGRVLKIIRATVSSEFTSSIGFPVFRLIEGNEKWSQKWMWPTAIGTVTSLVFGVFLMAVILIPADVPQLSISTEAPNIAEESIFLARSGDQFITPQQFAHSRADISQESPSLNPAGTLVDMTRADSRDDEVVVVADVYGNGSAEITDIVESPRDRKVMDRLIAAFRSDRAAQPFLPASMDNRENFVRVVLKFQNVNVNIDESSTLR